MPGWTPHDQLLALHALALGTAHLPGDLLELGSWCGRSAVALGLAAAATGVRVHCIDLFPARDDWSRNADGSYSLSVRLPEGVIDAYTTQTVWKEPFERDIAPLYARFAGTLDVFRDTIARHGLAGSVRDYRGTSAMLESAIDPAIRLRLAFVDGDHGYDAVCRDIDRIAARLVPGGWLCFDDAFTSYEGVDRAIRDRVLESGRFDATAQLTRKMFVARKRAA